MCMFEAKSGRSIDDPTISSTQLFELFLTASYISYDCVCKIMIWYELLDFQKSADGLGTDFINKDASRNAGRVDR